ncbi:uncharacterized protein LOC118735799 [Rhagoletis pomonella]|uniref:uncharacterized protein LOC118735799 n=1 Tax=Rhagoletis pomonella TaxID=28610 RepID=UPI00177F52ED|nr:uncharacterized protein LOC118735799 [Rhagoletis pomonella]
MRCALLIFVAVVGSAAGHRYGNLPTSAGYALPASVTSAVAAATRVGSGEATTSAVDNANSINELLFPKTTTTTAAATAALESTTVTESPAAAASESSGATTTQSASTANFTPTAATAAASIVPATATSTKPPQALPPKDEEAVSESLTELPVSSPPTAISLPESVSDVEPLRRRVVTYDQRQEGQYNIRADLENFMIVLIPPSSSEGLNFLDLLSKSALRRNSLRSKSKRKHFTNAASANKYRNPLKSSASLPANLQYVGRQSAPNNLDASRGYLTAPPYAQTPFDAFIGSHSSPAVYSTLGAASNRLTDFIEGRTTSRFDIAAANSDPDRPVDVLPPPYPLAYQHLIKPFHLEAEPTVIQALPPPELNTAPAHISGNYLDSYNQLLAPGLSAGSSGNSGEVATISTATTTTAAAVPSDSASGYYRLSRAIRGENLLDSNRGSSLNSIHQNIADLQPVYRAEHSLGATYLYPPIDTPRIYFNSDVNAKEFEAPHDAIERSQIVDDVDDNAHVGELYVPPRELKDDIEWEHFFDTMVKEANDSLCMPGQRRDSYGMCRQVEGY